jgi:hypothetical protein
LVRDVVPLQHKWTTGHTGTLRSTYLLRAIIARGWADGRNVGSKKAGTYAPHAIPITAPPDDRKRVDCRDSCKECARACDMVVLLHAQPKRKKRKGLRFVISLPAA